ncbi:MAG: ribosome silencing factor [Burkholderiales bacterium]
MDIRKLQRVIVDGLEDLKAQNILVFNTEHLSSLFERVIIASGTSNRQTKSLATSVREAVKKAGYPVPRTEGEGNGEWIIVDCGAAVVHVMQPTIRDYYHLEEIWGDKPVSMKLTTATTRLVKAAEPDAPVKKSAAKKAPAKAAPAKAAPAKKAAAKKGAPAKTPAAGKTPARKIVKPTTRMVTRVIGVKKTPAKKGAAPKAAPRKAPAKKVARKA